MKAYEKISKWFESHAWGDIGMIISDTGYTELTVRRILSKMKNIEEVFIDGKTTYYKIWKEIVP